MKKSLHAQYIFEFGTFSGNETPSTNFRILSGNWTAYVQRLTNGQFHCVPFPQTNALHGSCNVYFRKIGCMPFPDAGVRVISRRKNGLLRAICRRKNRLLRLKLEWDLNKKCQSWCRKKHKWAILAPAISH